MMEGKPNKPEMVGKMLDWSYDNYRTKMQDPDWKYRNRLHLEWFTHDVESEKVDMGGPCYRALTRAEFVHRVETDEDFRKEWYESRGEDDPIGFLG